MPGLSGAIKRHPDHHILRPDVCGHMELRTVWAIRSFWAAHSRCHRGTADPRPRRTARTWPPNNPLAGAMVLVRGSHWTSVGHTRSHGVDQLVGRDRHPTAGLHLDRGLVADLWRALDQSRGRSGRRGTRMARIRPPGAAGETLAASLNRDPGRADHHLAPATLLCRRGQPAGVNHFGRCRWAVCLHICGYVALQPHWRQRADDDHPSCGGREYPGRGMGVYRPVNDCRGWCGDLRLEDVAKSRAPISGNTATGSAAKFVTRDC
jgi:hypothetical protein